MGYTGYKRPYPGCNRGRSLVFLEKQDFQLETNGVYTSLKWAFVLKRHALYLMNSTRSSLCPTRIVMYLRNLLTYLARLYKSSALWPADTVPLTYHGQRSIFLFTYPGRQFSRPFSLLTSHPYAAMHHMWQSFRRVLRRMSLRVCILLSSALSCCAFASFCPTDW